MVIVLPSAAFMSAMYLADCGNGFAVAAGGGGRRLGGVRRFGGRSAGASGQGAKGEERADTHEQGAEVLFHVTSMNRPQAAAHEECVEIAWRSRRRGRGNAGLTPPGRRRPRARNTCHAGSAAVSRWLLLDSATSRESGISAASSSPKRMRHAGGRRANA